MAKPQYETGARIALSRVHQTVATMAALIALPSDDLVDGCRYFVQDGSKGSGSSWIFSSSSTATDAANLLAAVPTAGGGSFLRTDPLVDLKLAIDFNATDAQVLYTVPTGFRLFIRRAFWEVTASWTGGAASAIGLSSNNSAYNVKGDLLGGAGGDVAATLVSTSPGPFVGTTGAKTGGAAPVVIVGNNTILFNRITSAFTAGTGFAHVVAQLVS